MLDPLVLHKQDKMGPLKQPSIEDNTYGPVFAHHPLQHKLGYKNACHHREGGQSPGT